MFGTSVRGHAQGVCEVVCASCLKPECKTNSRTSHVATLSLVSAPASHCRSSSASSFLQVAYQNRLSGLMSSSAPMLVTSTKCFTPACLAAAIRFSVPCGGGKSGDGDTAWYQDHVTLRLRAGLARPHRIPALRHSLPTHCATTYPAPWRLPPVRVLPLPTSAQRALAPHHLSPPPVTRG